MLRVAITMGDPAGIGPEVILKALRDLKLQRVANFVIIGNFKVFAKTQKFCKTKLKIDKIKSEDIFAQTGGDRVGLLDVGNISRPIFGRATHASGRVALECIDQALRLANSRKIDTLITAPVNKHTITQTESLFRGHTEYLAKGSNTKNFAMMLIGGPFKVVLVTRHIALKDVPGALTKDKIYQTLCLSASCLKKYFGIKKPRIGVCGLNPHGGEEGVMGSEEAKIIRPAVIQAKRQAVIEGPLPADTIFYLARQGKFDAVCAMYHDQGLIPIKTYAFHQGVNLTLGLPFVRTSCDHGTAYDIAGKNCANPGSMKEAIKLAIKISSRLKSRK